MGAGLGLPDSWDGPENARAALGEDPAFLETMGTDDGLQGFVEHLHQGLQNVRGVPLQEQVGD